MTAVKNDAPTHQIARKSGDDLARRLQIEPTPTCGSMPSRAFSTIAVLSPAAPLRRGLCCRDQRAKCGSADQPARRSRISFVQRTVFLYMRIPALLYSIKSMPHS